MHERGRVLIDLAQAGISLVQLSVQMFIGQPLPCACPERSVFALVHQMQTGGVKVIHQR
ncbi:hypothetical protein D3C86_2105690 [compost metagenome]